MNICQSKLLNKIVPVAIACTISHANANEMSAVEKAILDDANVNQRVIFISGSSAIQEGFLELINTLFSGTPIRFASTTASSRDYEAVAGRLAVGGRVWVGQNAIIIYRAKGGSVHGVNAVARAQAIESLDVTSATCGGGIEGGAGVKSQPYVCSTTPLSRYKIPDAGVSDVDPKLFQSPLNTEGENPAPALSEEERADLSGSSIYGLAFGVAVTKTISNTAEFSRSAVAAILTGNISNWSEFDSASVGDIVICRQIPGGQAVENLYFGNYPCGSMHNAPLDRDSSGMTWDPLARTFTYTGNIGAPVVIENSTSGDVRNCLDKAVTGGIYSTKDRDGDTVTVDMGTGNHKAIGILSLDSLKYSKATGNWQFRSLDGAGTITWDNALNRSVTAGNGKFPTFEAYEKGHWDLQGWITLNIPTRTTGNKQNVLNSLWYKAQNPEVLAAIPELKNVAAAIPGYAFTGPHVLDAGYLNGDQCAPYNRNWTD